MCESCCRTRDSHLRAVMRRRRTVIGSASGEMEIRELLEVIETDDIDEGQDRPRETHDRDNHTWTRADTPWRVPARGCPAEHNGGRNGALFRAGPGDPCVPSASDAPHRRTYR